MIFPEGCTTNGKQLIKFKKGAFASLMPVKPFIHVGNALRGNPVAGDAMNMWHWSFLLFGVNIL